MIETRENKILLSVSKSPTISSPVTPAGSSSALSVPKLSSDRYLMPTADIYPSKAMMTRRPSSDTPSPSQSDTSASAGAGSGSRTPGIANGYASGKTRVEEQQKPREERHATATAAPTVTMDDLDVQSVINERRPSKLKTHSGAATSSATSCSDQYSAAIRGEGYGHIYVGDDKSDEMSPCGNASESGTGSISAAGSISVAGSISAAGSISCGSGSGSGSGSRSSGGSGVVGVHIGEGGAIGSDVRIYVDDTDSVSSNGHRRGRLRDDETLDASTTVSSTTTMRDGGGGNNDVGGSGGSSDGREGGKRTPERPSSADKSLDPS